MSQIFLKKNIYDKNGVLLLAKGQRTTEAVLKKLRTRVSFEAQTPSNSDTKQKESLIQKAWELGEKMNIRDVRILETANRVLSTIIFDSKSKPWWIVVNAMTNYVDWMYTHSLDVAMISLMIGIELNYGEEELWNLGLGAFLHDAGKLLIPKLIIEKPGPLDDMEMTYMRQHCELGFSSLAPFYLPKDLTDIVLQHHERMDGSGYPFGLIGEEISRNARIVMVADTVDAITSGRPYMEPKSMEAAIQILGYEKNRYPQELITLLERMLE